MNNLFIIGFIKFDLKVFYVKKNYLCFLERIFVYRDWVINKNFSICGSISMI